MTLRAIEDLYFYMSALSAVLTFQTFTMPGMLKADQQIFMY